MSSNYACPCLNVLIAVQAPPPPDTPPSTPSDSNYQPVYVGEEGVSIVHPQLTLRSRTHSEPESKSALLFRRHTSLTCLICRTSVYRVLQLVPPDLDAGEGPVLPTEEWVEQEVLRSESGWIELAKQCLTDESMAQLRASDAYSPVFRVALPARLVHVPTSPLSASHPSSPKPPQPEAPHNVLPPLSPLFPPPPFVPSHPAFDHLSTIALQRSDQLRKIAEEQVSQIVRARVSAIEKEETELRRQVQLLWAAFREAESTLIQEQRLRSPSNQPIVTDSAGIPPLSLASPVAINDFIPVSIVKPSSLIRDIAPSALSTSLAGSSFHHPKTSSEGRPSTSPIAATPSSSLPTGPTPAGSIGYRDPVRRDMNENKDIATSFKYVVDMESERNTRTKQYQSLSNIKSPRVNAKLPGSATIAVSDSVEHSGPVPGPSTPHNRALPQESLSPSGSKGKRKVTFDIKPAVSGGEKRRTEVLEQQGEASIFDLEDDDSDASPRIAPDGLILPLREPPRVSSNPALPQSLQMLRPASLPATVALRASDTPQSKPSSLRNEGSSFATEESIADNDENLSQRDKELARLVNVVTPSHRNAWKKDSRSWRLFFSGNAEDTAPGSPDSESEAPSVTHDLDRNGNYEALLNSGVAASLPISIALVPRSRVKNYSSDEPDSKTIPTSTSAGYRKASYAARDRSRSLDPGALDFETIGEEESIDGDDGDPGSLSRGRHRALKILQARSTLPAEGMWRSLAT
ncbi:hypothetical protein EDB92DRAFT_1832331 [Lactarius akahatsu]|uniref:Uncharacterized protein n=1 Tax=Lactarius akahatsu TaxID=416441 RepID=A0AAD4LQE1_9AGAM|nr:hypothetical protein EDB92DRAFT_1832331 [Lactarius akahatsu]